ncbi:hypothetical protein DRO69_02135 [Candidatus Bathyarchaeota archaeon]|nr:MAG: hypothetical protein DRO69_02135 [Candidatus Bathyarchaeota archaeon]
MLTIVAIIIAIIIGVIAILVYEFRKSEEFPKVGEIELVEKLPEKCYICGGKVEIILFNTGFCYKCLEKLTKYIADKYKEENK